MKILFLHGWHSAPGGVKPTYLKDQGHEVINPALDDDDFEAAIATAQDEYDLYRPDVIVGSSRGGAVALNIDSGETPLVLLCPAWKRWGVARVAKPNTVILHSRADDVVPFDDSEELVKISGLPPTALIEVGYDHRLADTESLEAMFRSALDSCLPEWSDNPDELLQQEWSGLCYSAAMRWITVADEHDWLVVHGSVLSGKLNRRIEHAWCERDDVVVDLTMPVGSRRIPQARYYETLKPESLTVYPSNHALILSIRTGHQGPWSQSERQSHE